MNKVAPARVNTAREREFAREGRGWTLRHTVDRNLVGLARFDPHAPGVKNQDSMEPIDDEGLCAEADSPPGKEDQKAFDGPIRGPGQQLQETVEGMDSRAGVTEEEGDGCWDRG